MQFLQFFFAKTGSVNSATEKGDGGQQCTNVTLPRKKSTKRLFLIFENNGPIGGKVTYCNWLGEVGGGW
jgi:hypothetical protein